MRIIKHMHDKPIDHYY